LNQDHDLVLFSFWSIKPAMLSASMLGDYSTSASSTPFCFPLRTDLLWNSFLFTPLLDLLFLLLWIIIPAILSITMLGYYSWVHLWCPLNFFIIVSIYWKPASYRSSLDLSSLGKNSNRSAAELNSFFFLSFGPTCMLFDLSIALWLRHDLSKVAVPTPRSGLVRHGYPWVPTDQAHGRPEQVGPAN
jgi:hypothetical protein